MRRGSFAERFVRTEQLIGSLSLERLARSKIAVFGLGAVGSYSVEFLARSGVGNFVLVDFDQVRYSNFNRQILALEPGIGELKVKLQAERLREINPRCKIKEYPVFAGPENFSTFLSPKPAIVVDAIDSVGPKVELLGFCCTHEIPVISSLGSGAKTDPFSVRVGDISEVRKCALGSRVRKELRRKKKITRGIRCVYSTQPPLKTSPVQSEEEFYHRGRKRAPVGTISYMTGIFGSVVAYEVIRAITSGLIDSK
jgi:tRNA threonylcarbamoyladenosine dehydratase